MIKCSECGKDCEPHEIRVIDGKPVCCCCIYQDETPFPIYPIGKVVSTLGRAEEGFGTTGTRGTSRIELLPSQERFLHKIGEEKYLTIVYYLHRSRDVKSVFRRGLDGKEVGVFASRTPDRLTPIGVTEVELERVDKTTLYVRDLDAINGSPVLDIKLGWKGINR